MRRVAIGGAGQLGGAVGRRLADGALARHVLLVDEDVGKARGAVVECALDPVDRVAFDTAAERRWTARAMAR